MVFYCILLAGSRRAILRLFNIYGRFGFERSRCKAGNLQWAKDVRSENARAILESLEGI